MLATAPVRSHDPPDLGAQGLAVEAPAVRPATAGGRAVHRVLGVAPGPVEAGLRMLGAAASDVAGALGGSWPTDPLSERDPDYIRDTLAALRLLSSLYFRADVRGLENIPATGPVLLVGNHSGGTLIADTFVFAQAFYDHFGPERRFHQLAHDLVFKVPGTRALVQRYGTIPASPEHMRARSIATRRCWSTRAETTRPTARPGSPTRSGSAGGPGSSSSRSSTGSRSCRWSPSAVRRRRCSSVAAVGWRAACSWTACCA